MTYELDDELAKRVCQLQTILLEQTGRAEALAAVAELEDVMAQGDAKLDHVENLIERTADDIEEIKGST